MMKKCLYCAEKIQKDAIKCKHCGSNLDIHPDQKPSARMHSSYNLMTLVCFFFPYIGFILGIVHLTKNNPIDKKLGEHCLAISILFFILWAVVWNFFLASYLFPIDTYTSSQGGFTYSNDYSDYASCSDRCINSYMETYDYAEYKSCSSSCINSL